MATVLADERRRMQATMVLASIARQQWPTRKNLACVDCAVLRTCGALVHGGGMTLCEAVVVVTGKATVDEEPTRHRRSAWHRNG